MAWISTRCRAAAISARAKSQNSPDPTASFQAGIDAPSCPIGPALAGLDIHDNRPAEPPDPSAAATQFPPRRRGRAGAGAAVGPDRPGWLRIAHGAAARSRSLYGPGRPREAAGGGQWPPALQL